MRERSRASSKSYDLVARVVFASNCGNVLEMMRDKTDTYWAYDEYVHLLGYHRLTADGLESALKAVRRWPRLQPHWNRIRRRICDDCGKQASLSEPRFEVCSGCGVARYCSEECQISDWWHHESCCPGLAQWKISALEIRKMNHATLQTKVRNEIRKVERERRKLHRG